MTGESDQNDGKKHDHDSASGLDGGERSDRLTEKTADSRTGKTEMTRKWQQISRPICETIANRPSCRMETERMSSFKQRMSVFRHASALVLCAQTPGSF